MQALVYLKIATAAFYKVRESADVDLSKAHKYLERSCASIKLAKDIESKDSPNLINEFAKQYLQYQYYQDLMGICLKMKPFENQTDQTASFQKMAEAFKELEINYMKLEEDKLWSGPEVMPIFGPLADKLHIPVDHLKKLLHSPLLTNQVIARPVVNGEQHTRQNGATDSGSNRSNGLYNSTGAGGTSVAENQLQSESQEDDPNGAFKMQNLIESTKEILTSLKQATEEAEELHPKGRPMLSLSQCVCVCVVCESEDSTLGYWKALRKRPRAYSHYMP